MAENTYRTGAFSAAMPTPDVAGAASLYAAQCAGCHGASGRGDGPAAAGMVPAPIAFTDLTRATQRSPLALYEAISRGVAGTAMPAYAQLDEAQRWALAQAERGRRSLPLGVVPETIAASTDFGNVSVRVPGIHPLLKIADENAALHTRDFAEAAASLPQ